MANKLISLELTILQNMRDRADHENNIALHYALDLAIGQWLGMGKEHMVKYIERYQDALNHA